MGNNNPVAPPLVVVTTIKDGHLIDHFYPHVEKHVSVEDYEDEYKELLEMHNENLNSTSDHEDRSSEFEQDVEKNNLTRHNSE